MLASVGLVEWWAGRAMWSDPHHQCLVGKSSPDAASSQCVVDEWTLVHIQHGLLVVVLRSWLFPLMQKRTLLRLGMGLESIFEMVENQDWAVRLWRIDKYRGDTVINSFCDLFACWFGLELGWRLGIRKSFVVGIAIELLRQWWRRECARHHWAC